MGTRRNAKTTAVAPPKPIRFQEKIGRAERAIDRSQIFVAYDDNDTCDSFFVRHRARFLRGQNITAGIESRLLQVIDPFLAQQVTKRVAIQQLPLSAATSDLASKARLDLSRTQGFPKGSQHKEKRTTRAEVGDRKCKYCHTEVPGSFYKHFKACQAAKKARRSGVVTV
jgi:hypothetical protein